MESLSKLNRPEGVQDESTASITVITDKEEKLTDKKEELSDKPEELTDKIKELLDRKEVGHSASIKEHRSSLLYYIVLAHGLQDELRPILTDEQLETIQSKNLASNRVGQLLDYVVDMPLDKQEQFLEALEKTSQKHVANFIRQKGQRASGGKLDEWPLLACEPELRSLDSQWSNLIELIDSRNGLVDEMFQAECISFRLKEQINDPYKTDAQRNEQILFYLRHKSLADYRTFIDCLVKTKQHHAVFLVSPSSAGDQLPLSNVQLKSLTRNYVALKSAIDPRSGLLDCMFASGCITYRQKEYIEAAGTPSDGNDRLLTIVRRGSQADFGKFIDGLVKSKQQHICAMLSGTDGVVAHIVAKTHITDSIKQDEQRIVEQIVDLLRIRTPGDRRQLLRAVHQQFDDLEKNGVDLVAARTETSIGLFYLCKSYAGLQYLYQLYESGDLKRIFSRIFSLLLGNDKSFEMINYLSWDMSNLDNCIQFAYESHGLKVMSAIYSMAYETRRVTTTHRTHIDIERLPYELIEMTLVRTAVHLVDVLGKRTPRAEVYAIATLSAVSRLWWVTFNYRRYNKNMLKRSFRKICSPFARNPSCVAEINVDANNCVSGLAAFDGKLYVTLVADESVQVFDVAKPSKPIASIKVSGLMDPRDCVVWPAVKRLCVADWSLQCVWLVRLLTDIDEPPESFSTHHCRPWSLSTRCKRLLVTQFEGCELVVYSETGLVLKNIQLPRYMRVRSALESRHGTYIVSHRNSLTDHTQSDQHSVSEVDANGHVIRMFHGLDVKLNNAWHAVLGDVEHVLIADRFNERIVLLRPDLTLKRLLLTGLPGQPRRLCYSSRSGLLFIAFWESTNVCIYRVAQRPTL